MILVRLMPLLLLILCFASCEDFLDRSPLDSVSSENYYQTQEQLQSALAGVYDILSKKVTYGDYMVGAIGLDGDEAYFARNTVTADARVSVVSASDPFIAANWQAWYDGINRANMLIANIDRPDMDAEIRKNILGEALFLRAYYHLMLVTNWGDVPLITEPISSAEQTMVPRTPALEVYRQILADMTEAEALVKPISELGFAGRVSKSAVRGMLARVCLYMAGNPVNDRSKYEEAKKWAKKVIDPDPETGFQHELNPSYAQVFINMCQDKYDIKESIWEVEFAGNATDAFREIGRVGSNNGVQYLTSPGDPDYGYSYGFIGVTARLFRSYESLKIDSITPSGALVKRDFSPDFRRDWSIANYRLSGNPAKKAFLNDNQLYERNSAKWRRELEVITPKTKDGGPINFPLLRFSDVLLMYAEAENELNGPTEVAISAVNTVRRRAYGKLELGNRIKDIVIVNQGSGYSENTTVQVIGGGGSNASVAAKIENGKIVAIAITDFGMGYTSVPDLVITDVSGNGAMATASITQDTDADLPHEYSATKEAFFTFLQSERSRELCFESLRKSDLRRWGNFLERMKLIANDFTSGDNSNPNNPIPAASSGTRYGVLAFNSVAARDVYWPISPRELGLNPALSQNQGW